MPGKERGETKTRAAETLGEVDLSQFADRYAHELPGRQKQWVRFSRKLINQRHSLLLDEPMGALDEKLRENMQRKFINLQAEAGAAAFRLHAPKTKH